MKVELLPGEVRVATAEGTPHGSAPIVNGPAGGPHVAERKPVVRPPTPRGVDAGRAAQPRAVGRLFFKDDFDPCRCCIFLTPSK